MEVSTSSSPLSIYSPFTRLPCRVASAMAVASIPCHRRRRHHHHLQPYSASLAACSWKESVSVSVPIPSWHSFSVRSQRRKARRRMEVSAVFERFTERAIKAIIFSQREARDLGKDMVFNQHLLLGLIAEEEAGTIPISNPNGGGSGHSGFLGSNISLQEARAAVATIWPHSHPPPPSSEFRSSTDMALSTGTKRVLEGAVEYSRSMGHHFIAPEHIAIALFTVDDGSATKVLKRLGANMNYLAAEALSRLQGELASDGRVPTSSVTSKALQEKPFPGKPAAIRSFEKSREKSALARFCVDLTARASEGRIDPVIGRDIEVKRIIQILGRRTKNNPILLGEAGVGKTAIAEGLAIKIADLDVPPFLLSKRIMSLDVGLLIAGAKERGELEARVTAILKDIKKSGNVILFIDEVHTIIGSGTVGRGNKGSGLDVANLLKPSLGRSDLQCIASTTMDEYRAHLESDKALARRFQPVVINEPSEEDTVRILLGLLEKYESHHKCKFTLQAIDAAVHLSSRYIPDRYLPDKAIDLLDEAGSRAHIEAFKKKREQQTCILSKSPNDYWQEIRTVKAMQEVVLASRPMYNNDASSMEDSDFSLSSDSNDDEMTVVGPDDIAAVVSLWSGIPVQKLTTDERLLLVGLEENLRKRVVGQEEAVSAISRAVKRSRVGLKDPKRPIAAMLFCGPTGVGKTELTKALAACYFGSEAAILRLDMSEYMERHAVSKLIGAPPGYIGYGEGGTLTEAIRRRPFTVVLLDEIEKAHPDIFNILLQMFEDGHLTDSEGRRVSFKNALVVMTSNVGSGTIAKGGRGFFGFVSVDNDSTNYTGLKALVMEELKAYFRPELLNRMDEVVVFRALEKNQMMEILSIMLGDVRKRLIGMGIRLEVSELVKDLVCQQGYDRVYGARPLRRAVSLIIEDLLSEALLSGNYKPGDTAVIDLDSSGNPFVSNRTDQSIHLSDSTSIF